MNTNRSDLYRFVRLVFVVLMLLSAVVLLFLLARFTLIWFVLPIFVQRYVSELARLAGWGQDLTGAVTVAAVFVISYIGGLVFGRDKAQRRAAMAVLTGLMAGYFGLHEFLTRGQIYDEHGHPRFYWGLTPSGEIYQQTKPGLNPYTRQPLQPASPDYFILVRSRLSEALRETDPGRADWFDANTGWPLLWWARTPGGQMEFFRRPGIHPLYQIELQPVSTEVRHEYDSMVARKEAEREALAAQNAAKENTLREEQRNERERKERAERERVFEEKAQTEAEDRAKAAAAKQALELEQQRKTAQEAREQRRAVLDRRAREAVAPIDNLECLTPEGLLTNVCPSLNSASFRPGLFEKDFAERRFRFQGDIDHLRRRDNEAWFTPTTIGDLHLIVRCVLQPGFFHCLKANRQATVAGTVARISFWPGTTNINGLVGQVCIVDVGNAVVPKSALNVARTPSLVHTEAATTGLQTPPADPPATASTPTIYSSSQLAPVPQQVSTSMPCPSVPTAPIVDYPSPAVAYAPALPVAPTVVYQGRVGMNWGPRPAVTWHPTFRVVAPRPAYSYGYAFHSWPVLVRRSRYSYGYSLPSRHRTGPHWTLAGQLWLRSRRP